MKKCVLVLVGFAIFCSLSSKVHAVDLAEPENGQVVGYSTSHGSYPGDYAFDGNDTPGATPGRWLPQTDQLPDIYVTYQFTNGVSPVITRYRIMSQHYNPTTRGIADFKLQGSNNGTDWTDLDTVTGEAAWAADEWRNYDVDSPGTYSYYKLLISAGGTDAWLGIREIELHADLTDSTSGHVTEYSSSHSSYPGTKAFDDDVANTTGNRWLPYQSELPNVYATWQFTNGMRYVVDSYLLIGQHLEVGKRGPKDFKLQGSNNGTDWTDLDTVTGETGWTANEARQYEVDSPGGYDYYKLLVITGELAETFIGLREIELFGSEAVPVIETLAASDVETWSATFRGDLTSTGTAATTVWVYYGETDGTNNPASWDTNALLGVQSTTGVVSTNLAGLDPETTYYYRFYASNSVGTTWADASTNFTTEPVPPLQVVNLMPTLTADNATLRGDLVATGTSATTVWVYYGDEDGETNAGSWDANVSFGVQASTGALSTVLSGLAASDIRYYRFYASNATETDWAPSTVRLRTPTDFTAWGARMPISFTNYTRTTELDLFPVLVKLNESVSGFSYDQFASPTGADLRFAAGDEVTELNYEIDVWDTGGTSLVWVQVPHFTNNATIYAYWGKEGATTRATSDTWSGTYLGVYHLHDDSDDSTANGNDGTDENGPTDCVGVVGDGLDVSGGAHVDLGGTGWDEIDSAHRNTFTMGAWVNPDSLADQTLFGRFNAPGSQFLLWLDAGGGLANYVIYDVGGNKRTLEGVGIGAVQDEWQYVVATSDGANLHIYVNGMLSSDSGSSVSLVSSSTLPISLGTDHGDSGSRPLDGSLDEARIAYACRPLDWIWAEYMNMASNDHFNTMGTVESRPLIATLAASSLGATSATLSGDLTSTGTTETTVWVYLGDEDGGDRAGAWDTDYSFGAQSATNILSTNLTSLAAATRYYYRFVASNSVGVTWASETKQFVTPVDFGPWLRRMPITFNYDRATPLTNFPMLINLSASISGFDYDDFESATGGDLRFAMDDDVSTLYHEIDEWHTDGTSAVWVQIPVLTDGTTIYAYWGNAAATTAPAYTTNGSVWSEGHVGVWHMKESGNAPADSALIVGDNSGIDAADPDGVVTDAIVGKGYEYVDNGRVDISSNADLHNLAQATLMCWYYKRSQGGGNYGTLFGRADNNGGLRHHSVAGEPLDLRLNGAWVAGSGPLANGGWHFLAYTFDDASGDVEVFLNGASVDTSNTGHPWCDPIHLIGSGNRTDRAIDGVVDEMRASSVARSPDWIRACFMNVASNDVFVTPGTVTLGTGWPTVSTLAATGETLSGTTLRGDVTSTGTSETEAWVYWGTTDGTDNAASWDTNQHFGAVSGTGVISTNITGLDDDTTYYYRFAVSNDAGRTWATTTESTATTTDFTKFLKTLPITFTNYSRATPLTNFPVLVELSTGISDFSYDDFESAQGNDLRFSADDGTTALGYDVEEWNTSGESLVWVRVPVFTNDVTIHAYWGSADSTGSDSPMTGAAAWSDEYLGVYHLHADSDDSTVNANDGTDSGPTNVTGIVGDGLGFVGGANVNLGTGTRWEALDQFHENAYTLGVWVNPNTLSSDQALFGRFGEQTMIWLDVGVMTNYIAIIGAGGVRTPEGTGIEARQGEWQYVAATADGNTLAIYVNGVLSGSYNTPFNIPATSSKSFYLGTDSTGGKVLNGLLDEARIASAPRHVDWLWAEYMNIASNGAFNTYSNVVYNRPAGPGVTTLTFLGVGETNATLRGELTSTGTAETAVWVYYGETDGTNNIGAWDTNKAFGAQTEGILATNLTRLTPETTYYYRFYASNSVEAVWADASTNFTTLALTRPPEIANLAATGITHEIAWLRGDLTSTGTAETTVWVYWGDNDADTNALSWDTSELVGVQSSTGVMEKQITGLDPYTTYHYRFYASNSVGGAWAPATSTLGTALDYTDWTRKLRIDFTYNKATPLTNFPALVKLGSGLSGFSYDDFASATGEDLRFLSSDETTELNYEVEEWDTDGDSCVWVQVPELTSNSFIFAYWGNAAETTAPPCTTNSATWDDSFRAVWHLDQVGAAADLTDSTTNDCDGVNQGAGGGSDSVDGLISKGQDFERDDTDYIDLSTTPSSEFIPVAGSPISVSCWVKAETILGSDMVNRMISIHDGPVQGSGLSLSLSYDDRVEVYHDGTSPDDNLLSAGTVATGTWHYVVVACDGSDVDLYIDGVFDSSEPDSLNAGGSYTVKLGNYATAQAQCFDGIIDEMRVSKISRSADWVHASWLNQGSNDTFNSYGAVQSTGDADLPDVRTLDATNVLATTAYMNGELVSTGSSATAVSVYWGTSDGGTNALAWDGTNTFPGTQLEGLLSTNMPGLAEAATYYYRYYASNASGGTWASSTKSFVTYGMPDVDNDGGATERLGYALLNGNLVRTNGAPAGVFIHWGEGDGGTSAAAWDHTVDLGGTGLGAFQHSLLSVVSDWAGFQSTDIGAPTIPGSASYAAGTWTVAGGGWNFWNDDDEGHFAYREIAGDFEVYCRVGDPTGGTDDYQKVGLMARDSLTNNSKNAMILRMPSDGGAQVRFQRRLTDGANTADASSTGKTDPYYWLKLKREGDDFSAYYAVDSGGSPGSWTKVGGTPTIDMSDIAYLGLAVSARNDTEICTNSFDNWGGTGGDGELLYGVRYYYRCSATNSYGRDWAAATSNFYTTAPDWLALTNTTVDGIAGSTADIHATLTGTGAVFDVYAYWGEIDAETNLDTWAYTNYVGSFSNMNRDMVCTATGLVADTWYYYTFRATNMFTNIWASPSVAFKSAGAPEVTNSAPADVTLTSATLGGELLDGGSADATIYWGLTDGGETPGNWDTSTSVGTVTMGTFSTSVTVRAGGKYYYRCYVSNGAGNDWANVTTNFTTPLASISIADSSVSEGDSGTASMAFTVSLSSSCASNVTVRYASADATATAGSDYTVVDSTLLFMPGETMKGFNVTVQGDTEEEWPQENFHVNLSHATNCTLGDAQAVGTILEDDIDVADWLYKLKITFSGYDGSETLTNFPALVELGPSIAKFSYAQFESPDGYDLRFVDSTGTQMLSYEIEKWNTAGSSYVWVQVPEISGTDSHIWAYWGATNDFVAVSGATDVPDCVLWLKADAGVQTSGAAVTGWLDQSGQGNHAAQGSAGNQPTYVADGLNGKPVVRFDGGSADFMVAPDDSSLDNTAGLTIFAVVTPSNLSGAPRGILSKRAGSNNQQSYSLFFYTDDRLYVDIVDGNNRLASTGVFANGTTVVSEMVYDGSLGSSVRTRLTIDGAHDKTGAETSAAIPDYASDLVLGKLDPTYGSYLGGDYAEIIIYRRALSSDERQRVGRYLAQKYGLDNGYGTDAPSYATDGSTWSEGYGGVWHLSEGGSDSRSDSTANDNDSVSVVGTPDSAPGRIGDGNAFDGDDIITVLDSDSIGDDTLGSMSVSAWLKSDVNLPVTGDTYRALEKGDSYYLLQGNNGNLGSGGMNFFAKTPTSTAEATSIGMPLVSNQWYHITGTFDGADMRVYVDGVLKDTHTVNENIRDDNESLWIGADDTGKGLDGLLDELRISTRARSTDWVRATFVNTASNGVFGAKSNVIVTHPETHFILY